MRDAEIVLGARILLPVPLSDLGPALESPAEVDEYSIFGECLQESIAVPGIRGGDQLLYGWIEAVLFHAVYSLK